MDEGMKNAWERKKSQRAAQHRHATDVLCLAVFGSRPHAKASAI
jgi:hypothetical protein